VCGWIDGGQTAIWRDLMGQHVCRFISNPGPPSGMGPEPDLTEVGSVSGLYSDTIGTKNESPFGRD